MSSSASRLEQTPLLEMYRLSLIFSEPPPKSSLPFEISLPYSGAGAAVRLNDLPPRLSFEKKPLFLSPRSSLSENLERLESSRSEKLEGRLSSLSKDLAGRFVSSRSSVEREYGFSSREEYPPAERFLKFPPRDGFSLESSLERPYGLLPRDGLSDESSLRSYDLRGFEKSFESLLSENLDGRFESSRSSRERENGFSLLEENPEPPERFLKFPPRAGLSESSFRSYDLRGFEKSFESPREDLNGRLASSRDEDRSLRGESDREEFERAPLRPEDFLLPLLPSPELSRLGIWFF